MKKSTIVQHYRATLHNVTRKLGLTIAEIGRRSTIALQFWGRKLLLRTKFDLDTFDILQNCL